MKDVLFKLVKEIQPYDDFDVDTDLFENDILDSLEFAQLLSMIEEKFDIEIPEEMIDIDNFSTISKIEKMLKGIVK